jgi:hypothetical protein
MQMIVFAMNRTLSFIRNLLIIDVANVWCFVLHCMIAIVCSFHQTAVDLITKKSHFEQVDERLKLH